MEKRNSANIEESNRIEQEEMPYEVLAGLKVENHP